MNVGDVKWLVCPNCGPSSHVIGTEGGSLYSECQECGHLNDEGPDPEVVGDTDLAADDELHHVEPPC